MQVRGLDQHLDIRNLVNEDMIDILVAHEYLWDTGTWLQDQHAKRIQTLTCGHVLPSWLGARLHLWTRSGIREEKEHVH